jgi:hypothetical protein
MDAPPPASRWTKVSTIVWSITAAIGLLAFTISILLPSTKRSRIDFEKLKQMREADELNENTTAPSTMAEDETTTQPFRGLVLPSSKVYVFPRPTTQPLLLPSSKSGIIRPK